ncbi:MAG: extracellular solute-binding protein [Chloroflexota bacterium]|nr:extracellular solute-binding protein [Chloroflexota bacterium]
MGRSLVKYLGLLIVLWGCGGLLAACGLSYATPATSPTALTLTGKGSSSAMLGIATPPPSPTVIPTPTPWPAPQGEIVLWEQLNPAQLTVLQSKIEAFQKLYPEVQFDLHHFEGEQINSEPGREPHLLIAPNVLAGAWQRSQLILPLDPLFEPKFLEGFAPNVLQGLSFGGQVWALPYDFGQTLLLYYNKKLVEPDEVPNSWEAFTTYVRANPIKKNQYYPFAADLTDPDLLLAILGAFGGSLLDSQNQPHLNTEPMRQTLQFLQDTVYKYKLAIVEPNYATLGFLFRAGRVSFMIARSENLASYQHPDLSNRLELGVAHLPRLNGQELTPPSHGLAYFIGRAAQNDQAKLATLRAFLLFVSTPEEQRDLPTLLKLLPPTQAGLNDPLVKDDPLLVAVAAQLQNSKAIWSTPEWKAVIEAVRLPLRNVVADRASATEGAAAMQDLALKNLKK